MVPDQRVYRQIVDVLLAEHESSDPPKIEEYPAKMLACVWGLYAYIHRLARAATVLADNGMSFEANATIRIILEYTIVMHWIIEKGDKGVDAILANQSWQMERWLANTEGTELEAPPGLVEELRDSFALVDEHKALQSFKNICGQVDAQSLYALYGVQSNFVHPTTTTSNIFVGSSGPTIAPGAEHSSNMALVAHCLIWAERDFDRFTPGQPKTAGLEELAKSINARPILPPYRVILPRAKRNRRRRGRQKKRSR